MFIPLWVFPLMLAERPSTAIGRQSSLQNQPNHEVIYADQDSYQIYAALLEAEGRSLYVIQAEIHEYPNLTRKDLGIKGGKKFMREWGPAMDDYAKQNGTAKLLQRNFPLRASYELIPRSDIFSGEGGQKGWDDYYQRYPASGGFYWFSAVGFNPARTRAIVDMGHACGMLCGGGGPRFLEKEDGKWHEVSVKATLMVWFS